MATVGAKAIRRANAVARLERASAALGKQFSVEVPAAARYKDSDLQQSAEIEATATFLESLVAALGNEGAEGNADEGDASTEVDVASSEPQDAPAEQAVPPKPTRGRAT